MTPWGDNRREHKWQPRQEAIGGYLGPYRLKKALIDPGSMPTLVSEEFVNKHSIPMLMGSHIRIELANGQSKFLLVNCSNHRESKSRESRRHWTCPSSDHVGYTIFCWKELASSFGRIRRLWCSHHLPYFRKRKNRCITEYTGWVYSSAN